MERVFAGPLAAFMPVEIRLVGNSSGELRLDELVRRHQYLGYQRLLGYRLKYLAFIRGQPFAALSFSGAALMVRARDRFIDWNPEQRRAHLKSIANNSRFLILLSVQTPHLASHFLGRFVRRARHDCPQRSGHLLWIVETFVESGRYRGTSYRAPNWQYLGESKGYGNRGDHLAPQVMESTRGAADHPLPHPPQSSGLPGPPKKTSRRDVGSCDVTDHHAL